LTVPAIAALLREASWWPQRAASQRSTPKSVRDVPDAGLALSDRGELAEAGRRE
jgi:hypothetical protein